MADYAGAEPTQPILTAATPKAANSGEAASPPSNPQNSQLAENKLPASGDSCLPAGDPWRSSLWARALDLVYPVFCAGCGEGLSFAPRRHLCEKCFALAHRLNPTNQCRRCGEPLGPHAGESADCPQCRTRSLRFTRAVSAFEYAEPVRELVHQFKFSGVRSLARPLGLELVNRIRAEGLQAEAEVIVPVPLHGRRERLRGYNQSLLLSQVAMRELGLPLFPLAIRRVRDTKPQSLLSREERLRNPRGAFQPASAELPFASCLLIDDVMTTGATLSECAAALREGGVKRVYAATVAR